MGRSDPITLQLTEEEKSHSIDRILKATNPNIRSIPVLFSYRREDRTYKFVPTMDQTATHFHEDGNAIRKDSEEARKQTEERDRRHKDLDLAEQAEKNPDLVEQLGISTKILKNQFNFCDRASHTYSNPLREKGIMTEPPPIITFSSTATQWEIFDAYMEDMKTLQAAQQKAKPHQTKKDDDKKKEAAQSSDVTEDVLNSPQMLHSLRIMERMVVGNNFMDIQDDYKYWEDAADQYKEDGGSLLPLWKFSSDKVKKKTVTSICWNAQYTDLFAVGYGSYDFLKQGTGVIHCFTLKNPSHPEYTFLTDSGVMCLDFHRQHTSLLACGLYDGTVLVFDIRNPSGKPIYQSTVKTGKHTDPVWQIYWQNEEALKSLNFFSISSDGRVTNWILSKNELQYADVMELKLTDDGSADADADTALAGLSGGCCFDFSKFNESLFIVGIEEGKIRKCSRAYNSQYLETYDGHHMSVYSIQWNKFHRDVFLSASADWTVKVWEQHTKTALMSFDLGSPVGEAAWAPYSSTVFAAVTADGKVHVYDLNENKHEPVCDQLVVRKAKLTRICFNPKSPIILVGDDRGTVLSLKLSPNLRRKTKVEEGKTAQQMEIEKFDKLIAMTNKDRQLMHN